jgi:hypothetical protein
MDALLPWMESDDEKGGSAECKLDDRNEVCDTKPDEDDEDADGNPELE